MNKSELRAMLALAFQRYFEVRDIDAKRRRSFMSYVVFLTLWVVIGLLLIAYSYGSAGFQEWLRALLHLNKFPHYFPTISYVIWAGVIGSVTGILVKFINLNSVDGALVSEAESALRSGPAALAVGAALSLVTFCAFASGTIRGDLFPEFISSRQIAAKDLTTIAKVESNNSPQADNAPAKVAAPPAGHSEWINTLKEDTMKEDERFHGSNLDGESYYLFANMRELLPSSSKNLALLLLWCFIAGYSQTWILNWLKKLSDKAG